MAQQGAPGWQMGQIGSGQESSDGSSNHQGFNNFSSLSSQGYADAYSTTSGYHNSAFTQEGSSAYTNDGRSLEPPRQVEGGQNGYSTAYNNGRYPNPQQGPWGAPSVLPGAANAYAQVQGQHLHPNNEATLGMPTNAVENRQTTNQQIQSSYQAEPAPNQYGGSYQASEVVGAPPRDMAVSEESLMTTSRTSSAGKEWKAVNGCPNLLMGAIPMQRQIVSNVPAIKPHVAGDNRNGTRLLALLPDPLPCEVLREKVRPIVDELKKLGETITITKKQVKATSAGSAENKKYADELKKLEDKKGNLESEKKQIIVKASAGAFKAERNRSLGKQEFPVYDSESSAESSDEEDPQDRLVAQMMATARPNDPIKGVQYDIVKIIRQESVAEQDGASQSEKDDPWSKVIGQRVAGFGKYVFGMCAEAKALKEQRANAPQNELPRLQTSLDKKHDLIRIALDTALEFGDDETLRNMGQHMKLMGGLTATLVREFQSKRFNTDVQRAILRFMTTATLMDLDTFNRIKLPGTLEKYGGNLDDGMKQLADQIAKNAEERTAKNAEERATKNAAEKPAASTQAKQKPQENVKAGQSNSKLSTTTQASISKTKTSQATGTASTDTARKETKSYTGLASARKVANNNGKAVAASSTKRPGDGDVDSRNVKKVALEGNVTGSGKSASGSGPAAKSTSTSNTGLRPRTSGSMVLSKSRNPKPTPKPADNQSSVTSTIGGILAEIAKPTEKPKLNPDPPQVPETEDQKKIRLRKEERRRLVLRWKPDEDLVQVRFFEKDSPEENGRSKGMTKDARDNQSEGRMLKKMKQLKKESGEDVEDDGNPIEIELRPGLPLTLTDLSCLDKSQREKNYVTRGGFRPIESESKKIMDEYENRELMVVYTTRSEIPPSPRSPPPCNVNEPYVPPKELYIVPPALAKEMELRCHENELYGPVVTTTNAIKRLEISRAASKAGAQPSLSAPPTINEPMMTQEERDARVLSLLQSDKMKQLKNSWDHPDPYDPANPRIIEPPKTNDHEVLKAFSIIQNAVDQCRSNSSASNALPQGFQPNLANVQAKNPGSAAGLMGENPHARAVAETAPAPHAAPQAGPFAAFHIPNQMQQNTQAYPQDTTPVPEQYAAILRQVQALQNNQAAPTPAPPAPPVPQPQPPPANNGLASLLATLKAAPKVAQAPPAPPAPPAQQAQSAPQDANLAAWQAWAQSQAQAYAAQPQVQSHGQGYLQPQAQSQGQQTYAQQQAHSQGQSYPQYSQQFDAASRDEANYGNKSQGSSYSRDNGERGNRKEFHRGSKDHKGINRALIGTKPCIFWAKGQCAKGDSCTFRHDPNDLK